MRTLVALIAASLLALAGASPAVADENNCIGGLIMGGIHDDVKVLGGTDCVIVDAMIKGSLQAEPGHGQVILSRSMVLGNVHFKGGIGGMLALGTRSFVFRTAICGNVRVEENANQVNVGDSKIGGDVQVFMNTGPASFIARNAVAGNLQCKDNMQNPVNASLPLPVGWPVDLNLGSAQHRRWQ